MPTTDELQKEITILKNELNNLKNVYYTTHYNDKDIFQNPVYFNTGIQLKDNYISLGKSTGTKVGLTDEKIAFLGATPVVRQASITAPSGGATVDSQSRTAINTIISVLQTFGLIN